MKIEALVVGEKKYKRGRRILIDSGNGCLEARISETLPGMRVIGVYFYPSLNEICIHVVKEEL